MLQDDNMKYK